MIESGYIHASIAVRLISVSVPVTAAVGEMSGIGQNQSNSEQLTRIRISVRKDRNRHIASTESLVRGTGKGRKRSIPLFVRYQLNCVDASVHGW